MSLFEPKTHKNQGINASNEAGSVLIWILVMVGLFAGLSYAVNQGSRGGASQISEEQARLAAAEILDYSRLVKDSVRLLQINGCDETEIDHGNTVYKQEDGSDNYPPGTNTNAPADGSCGIFHVNGGGIRPQIFYDVEPTPSGATVASGHASIASRDILGIGADGIWDRIFVVPGIKQETCIAINDFVGVENPAGLPPVEVTANTIIGDEATQLVGKNTFCLYRDSATNKRHVFHQVLIEN